MSPTAPGSVLNFEGIGNLNGVLPPDTNGDIGLNYYVQWVNLKFSVYDRTGSPQLLGGAVNGNQIWTDFGGACEATNDGDPIVLYDEAADRWLLSQFALPNFPSGPYYQCIAVSTTSDPTLPFHLYEYEFAKLNDYPKFGVWPDGYYMAINQYRLRGPFFRWAGQGVAAFERDKMLTGDATAAMVYFDMAADSNLGGMLPADLDGTQPPAGSGAYFAQIDDDAWGYSPDQIQIWELDVDWLSPTSSTFTKQAEVLTAAFDSNLCGYSRNCIPQPGTAPKLDALADRLMYRLQYRNLEGQETFVVSHSVDVNANDRAGVRWYEIRKVANAWTIHQQGTFAPADGNHRWMGTAAMDQAGNIALGYNVSGSMTSPSIRFTTRCATDTLGQMGGEVDLRIGGGQQTHSSGRWGDYSMLAVDPADGSTFWFTGEYYDVASLAGWKTYMGSFTVTCGPADMTPPTDPTSLTASNGTSSSQIDLTWVHDGEDLDGFTIERCVGDCTAGGTFSEHDTVGAAALAYSDTGLLADKTFTYQVFASDAAGNDSSVSESAVGTTSAATGTPVAPVLSLSPRPKFIRLSWSNVAGETGYNLYRNAAPLAFGPDVTTYNDRDVVAGVEYTYYVEACNGPGNCAASEPVSGSTR